ncbi:MAG: YcaO-like family protein [Pseudomonadota bacterium]
MTWLREDGGNGEKRLDQGSHRVVAPGETLDRFLPLRRQFGITRLADITGLDRIGLPVFLAIRPNARSIAISQGKGMTRDHAKASALMEAVEIWHAERFDRPVHFAPASDLAGCHAMVDLARLPKVRQGAFSTTTPMLWARARDLICGREMLVPYEMVHANYTHPGHPAAGCFPASTNGLASGNTLLEAVCHGICEVIERDALSVWHAAPQRGQTALRLDPESVDADACQAALSRFHQAGLECGIWDVTSDIGVATLMCVIRGQGADAGHLGLGSGTHPDRNVALQRAVTEAAQTRLNYISGAREDLSHSEYDTAGVAEKAAAFDALFAATACPRLFSEVPSRVHQTLAEDLDWLLARLRRASIDEVAVIDMTREAFSIPVARVIIPGLEAPHDDDSYLPGPRARKAAAREAVQ